MIPPLAAAFKSTLLGRPEAISFEKNSLFPARIAPWDMVGRGVYIRCILQIGEKKAAFVGRIRRSLVFFLNWDSLLSAEVTYAVYECSLRRMKPLN